MSVFLAENQRFEGLHRDTGTRSTAPAAPAPARVETRARGFVVKTVFPWVFSQSGQQNVFTHNPVAVIMQTRGSYCSFSGVLDRVVTHENTVLTVLVR